MQNTVINRTIQNWGLAILMLCICAALLTSSVQAKEGNKRYFVNSVYNIGRPNSWADMKRYKAFVDESKSRGFNSINMDVRWDSARPDGTYDFSLFDEQANYAISKGMYIWPRLNCSLINDYNPYWFRDEMYMRDISGQIYRHQNGPIPSPTHPKVLKEMARFCKAVTEHCDHTFKALPSGENPVVCMPFSFTATLEAEYFFDGTLDYSQSAQDQFRKWVRMEYPSLANLNAKWGTFCKTWDEVNLLKAHPTAKELYFESRLQILFDLIGNTVHKANPRMKVGMQVGCIWDIPQRRVFNVTHLLRKMDWILVADDYTYPHAFSADYARCSAPGKQISNEFGPGVGGLHEQQGLEQAVQTYAHGVNTVFTSNWSLEDIIDHNKWAYLREIAKLSNKSDIAPKSDDAIYLSTWDLINKRVDIWTYLKTYEKLSENGAKIVDVIPDTIIADNPDILLQYRSIYLPANYTITAPVRTQLLNYRSKLIVSQPDMAGTCDIYGRPQDALMAHE